MSQIKLLLNRKKEDATSMRKLNAGLRSVVDDDEDQTTTTTSASQNSVTNSKKNIIGSMQAVTTTSYLGMYKVPSYMHETDASASKDVSTGHGIGVLVKKPTKSGKMTTHKLFISRNNRKVLLSNSLGKSDISSESKKGLFRRSTDSLENKKISKFSKSIDIAIIDRVHRGQFSFKHPVSSTTTTRSIESTTSLSIIYDNGMKSLDLIIQDVGEFETLLKTMNELMTLYEEARDKVHPDVVLVENLYLLQDKNHTEKSSLSDINDMTHILSINMSKKQLSSLHKQYCESQL